MYFEQRTGDLVLGRDDHHTFTIPKKQVEVIRDNFARGVPFPQVSPLYPITRDQLAFIVTNQTVICPKLRA